jgi:hypothetical protein
MRAIAGISITYFLKNVILFPLLGRDAADM